ncbi:glycosyl hydrolase family 28-related protein [Caldibacillus debilis]|uniref:Endopolygalacturonase n=1 Tax=Caldibacillus debilis GB1 TaxID=1339248 RepID=A0A420VIW6_9BACI|nr:glycosyl hydrolase family 28-related protein [Caldibacillus debilis]RKO63565.1 Endopolygalacturonase [Caldibacillus debilis GB1]
MADAPKINPTDTLRESYPKLNQAIDNANNALKTANTAKETADQSLAMSENTQKQLNQIVIEGDSSVEAAQARVDAEGNVFATLKERLDTKETQFANEIGILNEQLADTTSSSGRPSGHSVWTEFENRAVNVKWFGAVGNGAADDTQAIQNALDSAYSNGGGIVLVPSGTFNISSTITIPRNVVLLGQGYKKSIINITSAVDGIVIEGSYGAIQGMHLKTPSSYSGKSAIIVTSSTTGHTWSQRISDVLIEGVDITGIGIKIEPQSLYGIMDTLIEKFFIRGYESAIYFNCDSTLNGWANGGTIKDGWQENCKYGVNFSDSSTSNSRWVIERFRGQYTSGVTDTHIANVAGTIVMRDCMLWDGGKQITLSPKSKGSIVDNCGTNSSLNMKDLGYLTVIRQGYETKDGNKYVFEEENFMGASLSAKWSQEMTGGTATLGTDITYNPFTSGLILETGNTPGNIASISYGSSYPYNRYLDKVMSFKFRVSDTTNVKIFMGFKTQGSISGNFLEITGNKLLCVQRSSTGDVETIDATTYLDTKQHIAQINIVDSNAHFHIDGNYLGSVPAYQYESQPYFYIQTNEAITKKLIISNLRIRSMQYYWV